MKITLSNKPTALISSSTPIAASALLALSLLMLHPAFLSVANAGLGGGASLTYTNQHFHSGSTKRSTTTLLQDYSLLYTKTGEIYNKRVGFYDVALGYNWTALDVNSSDSSVNVNRGNILYKGEILLDPKEVPFRLNAYSRDMTRNIVDTSGGSPNDYGSFIGYQPPSKGIASGLHVESGATLVAGVKNGMTNGYNELLRHFPMVLLDYKDVINKDLRAATEVNNRLSRLAFVSLNKKDNWFHYRHTLYQDYLDSDNNYAEDEVQIGSVDQFMTRRWIDFSNWMRVSTDLEFSRTKSIAYDNPLEEMNLNFFVVAERKSWNARSFTVFNRYKDGKDNLSYQTRIPLYLAGVYSQDVSWNTRTSFSYNKDLNTLGERSNYRNMLAGYRIDGFKRALFSLSQGLDVESSHTDNSDFLALSATVSTVSTPRFSRDVTLGASYNIKNSRNFSDVTATSDFLEQKLDLNGAYSPASNLRFEFRQNTALTKGSFSPFSSGVKNAQTQLGQYVNPRSAAGADQSSESISSLTSLTAAWIPRPRMAVSIVLTEDIYKTDKLAANAVTDMQSIFSYSDDAWNVTNALKYTRGSKLTLDENEESVSNSTAVRYMHSRNLDVSLGAAFGYADSIGTMSVNQNLNYSYYTRTGMSRKLLEFNQGAVYTNSSGKSDSTLNRNFRLGVKFFPVRQITLAGGIGYLYTDSLKDYTLVWNTSVVADLKLLQASIDYTSGFRTSDKARENKLVGNVRKSF